MKIIRILDYKCVKKSKKEIEREKKKLKENGINSYFIDELKQVKTKEPTYIIEMSTKEFQLVSFYLELERRKPIMNVKVDAKLKENKND